MLDGYASSTLDLARLQFAVTTSVHFLFVILTLGLVTLVAITQTRFVVGGNPELGRMARFWGFLYVINYAVGIASGLVMEFQFGLNWSGLSRITGDVFGAPLALETLIAFVLESTFLGMWIFGWGRLPKGVHLALIWGVTITAYLSAFWVLVANAFLQHPVGYAVEAGTARLTSLSALLGNPNLTFALGRVIAAALLTGVFFMAGLNQPTKLVDGPQLAEAHAQMVTRYGPGNYAPPSWTLSAFDWMTIAGNLFFLIAVAGLVLMIRNWLTRVRGLRFMLGVLIATVPLPFLTAIDGWLIREVGRQPWAVYGVLKTSDAVSDLSPSTMLASLIGLGSLL